MEFRGTGREYFRIWIVNVALSIVTLGIYSAWAKVRSRRYLYGNMRIEGDAFEYLANPKAILKGRILAAIIFGALGLTSQLFPIVYAILAIVLFLVSPWIIAKALRFNARVTAFRNIRFDFVHTAGQAGKIFVLLPMAIPFTLGLILPYFQARAQKYVFSGHLYGNQRFRDEMPVGGAYKVFLGALGLSVLLMVVMVGVLILFVGLSGSPEDIAADPPILPIAAAYLLLLVGVLGIQAFVNARMTNLLLNNGYVGGAVRFACHQEGRRVFGIQLKYGLLTLLTLGLAYPWLEIALIRYRASVTTVQIVGSLDDVIAEAMPEGSALADQLGEGMDFDIGFGF